MNNEHAAKAHQIIRKISGQKDTCNDTVITSQKYASFADFLLPFPLAVATLGELIIESRNVNIELVKPIRGFQYLSWDQIRPNAVQISHAAWDAFDTANKNMNSILFLAGGINNVIRETIGLVNEGSEGDIKYSVPSELKRILDICSQCTDCVEKTEMKFLKVTSMLAELLEACHTSKEFEEDKFEMVKAAVKICELEKKKTTEFREQVKQRYDAAIEHIKQSEEEFAEALSKLPTTGKIMGTAVGRALISLVDSGLSIGEAYTSMEADGGTVSNNLNADVNAAYFPNTSSSPSKTDIQRETEYKNQMLSFLCYQQSSEMIPQVESLYTLATMGKDGQPIWHKINAESNDATTAKDILQKIKSRFDTVYDVLQVKKDIVDICTRGIKVAEDLKTVGAQINDENVVEKVREIQQNASTLRHLGITFQTRKLTETATNPLDTFAVKTDDAIHEMLKLSEQGGTTDIAGNLIENAHIKVKMAQYRLKQAQTDVEKKQKQLQKQNDKLTNVLSQIFRLEKDTTETNLDEIIRILIVGIDTFTELRRQWGKLVQFFQQIKAVLECTMEVSVTNYIRHAKAENQIVAGHQIPHLFKDAIIMRLMSVSQASVIVQSISSLYVRLSREDFMENITNLDMLISLKTLNSKDKEAVQRKKMGIFENCQHVQKQIVIEAKEHTDELMKKIKESLHSIQSDARGIPEISTIKIKDINEAICNASENDDLEE